MYRSLDGTGWKSFLLQIKRVGLPDKYTLNNKHVSSNTTVVLSARDARLCGMTAWRHVPRIGQLYVKNLGSWLYGILTV